MATEARAQGVGDVVLDNEEPAWRISTAPHWSDLMWALTKNMNKNLHAYHLLKVGKQLILVMLNV